MRCRQRSKYFKQSRRCRTDALQVLSSLPFGIAEPHTDRIRFCGSDCPAVSVSVARTGLPRNTLGTGKKTPKRFIIGAHAIRQCFECQPSSTGRHGKDVFFGVSAAENLRRIDAAVCGIHKPCIGEYRFIQRNFAAPEDERQSVLVGRPSKGGKPASFKVVEKMTDTVFAEHPDSGNV